jgi:hypothetical protein
MKWSDLPRTIEIVQAVCCEIFTGCRGSGTSSPANLILRAMINASIQIQPVTRLSSICWRTKTHIPAILLASRHCTVRRESNFDLSVPVRLGPRHAMDRSKSEIAEDDETTNCPHWRFRRHRPRFGILTWRAIDASRDKARPCCRSYRFPRSQARLALLGTLHQDSGQRSSALHNR